MKKYLILSSIFLFLSSISIISYLVIKANDEVVIEQNIREKQKLKENYLTPYGYTLEEANVIINPYEISPLTALILFETKEEIEITLEIPGRDDETTIKHLFPATTKHYIPVYGLYPDTNNDVILKTPTKTVTYQIKTPPLPADFTKEVIINDTDNLTFLNTNNYLYAIDKNNDVRWFLEGSYKYNLQKLKNGNYLIPTTTLNTNSHPLGLMEIDLLGKIYKQYNLESGYYGSFIENDNNYYVLSKNLLKIDKQTGYLLESIPLKNKYEDLLYNKENNNLSLLNKTTTLSINLDTKEKTTLNEENELYKKEVITKLYNDNPFIITDAVLFDLTKETKQSKQNIFLIGYKKIDEKYKNYNIKITKNIDYLTITGDFEGHEVYLILDKLTDKRIYDLKNNYTLINKTGLKGKYDIYLKIDKTIYKTNKYLEY